MLGYFRARLEGLALELLDKYVTEVLPLVDVPPFGKEFNDPVWLTIKVRPLELLLLDSPLFQRLRQLKQLGVVHWVYPSATHTRFEHTLGVLCRVQTLIDSINQSGPDAPINAEKTRLLRLAALCHDLGHGFMSHVSENALTGLEDVELVRSEFLDQLNLEHIQISEMAAYYIVGSPAFRRLLIKVYERIEESYGQVDRLIKDIQSIIVGRRISNAMPLLHELISGPFDADKLDYMTRDARMAGVPVVTDIPRMAQKIRAIHVSPEDLRKAKLDHLIHGHETTYLITGIALSGGRALDELMFGRALLFDKIYRHQKVRAIEGMVGMIIYNLADILPLPAFELPYLFVDEEVLTLDSKQLHQKLSLHQATDEIANTHQIKAIQIACDLSQRLRERRLFVRAFAFALNTPQNPHRRNPDYRRGMEGIIRKSQDNRFRIEIVKRIGEEVGRILGLLKIDILALSADSTLQSYIWLDPPRTPSSSAQVSRALLITQNKKVIRFREDSAEIRGWSDAYLQTNDIGYVFCALELRAYVYLATEKIFAEEYGVQMDPIILNYAKQNEERIEKLRSDLARNGYYNASSYSLWPEPERLAMGDVPSICQGICAKLQGYEEPTLNDSGQEDLGQLNEIRVLNWVRQFRRNDIVSFALDIVNKIRLVGRQDCTATITAFLEAHPEFYGAAICSLGSAKDSGSITAYYAADVPKNYKTVVQDLDSALDSTRPLIFLDDIIGSGRQYVNTLHERLGRSSVFDLKETPRPPLSDARQKRLLSGQIAFLFSAGLDDGLSLLKKKSDELGIVPEVYAHISQQEIPTIFDGDLVKQYGEHHGSLVNQLKEAGHSLLTNSTKRHDDQWCKDRSLGYGKHGLLIAFPYNVPTQTLTCLWNDGKVDGLPWQRLLTRRQKE